MKMQNKTSDTGIWNNNMVKNAINALSQEDKERYKKIGEYLYKDVNFNTSELNDSNKNTPPYLSDATAYILESIKSGLHPSMLNENEKMILNEVLGNHWYTKYGYVEADLNNIVTLTFNVSKAD
jgi:hypothetical protein